MKRLFTRGWSVVGASIVLMLAGCRSVPVLDDTDAARAPSGRIRVEMIGEDPARYYLLYTPVSVKSDHPVPLVLVFHGGGGTPENIATVAGFEALADKHGFAVVHPSGTGPHDRRLFWNVLISHTHATEQDTDDLGFVNRLLDDVAGRVAVDRSRVYAAGFSQGGMLCYRIACDPVVSGRFAAIAPVAAVMTTPVGDCRGSHPMPVIAFNGLQDPVIRYEGGISATAPVNERLARPGVRDSIGPWIHWADLPETPIASGERGAASMEQYGPNERGYEVVLWTLRDGGHTWPGTLNSLPEWLVGNVNRDIDATELIWDFFSRHHRPK